MRFIWLLLAGRGCEHSFVPDQCDDPLADAHRSGGAGWDTARKTAFANYLAIEDALIAVSASANRSKGDSSPDQWLPPVSSSHCRYAIAWIDVKYQWALAVTSAEKSKLEQLLAGC